MKNEGGKGFSKELSIHDLSEYVIVIEVGRHLRVLFGKLW